MLLYKDYLFYDGYEIETKKWNLDKFKRIENSNYFTDGNSIVYLGNITGFTMNNDNNVDFTKNVVKDLHYSSNLKVINNYA